MAARTFAKKASFKKVLRALAKAEAVQRRINERINKGGSVPMAGAMTPAEADQLVRAQIEFNVRLAEALANR